MSFRSRGIILAVSLVFVVFAARAKGQSDRVADYLERQGLSQLLALHLEERMVEAKGADRDQITVRLAELYAQLLEATTDLTARVDLEARSRDLLKLVPDRSADRLRLALLRGAYVAAERVSENHRLRLSSEEDLVRAKAILTDTIPDFNSLRAKLANRIDDLERRSSRASPTGSSVLREALEEARALLTECVFLSGWALYYQSYLHGTSEHARIAQDRFAEILDPGAPRFGIEDVSKDLLETEAYARTLLGLALCRSLTSHVDDGLRWLDLLEEEAVFPAIRSQIPAWKLSVLLEHQEYLRAMGLLEQEIAKMEVNPGAELPLVWIRLAAVHALEVADRDRDAMRLASMAIAILAGRGELDQVLDLADRYGVESIGTTGFTALYVRGAKNYQQARELHGDEGPTSREDVGRLYSAAAQSLESAVAEPDASRFPAAAAGAGSLIGWCYYFQGRFFDARRAFEAAAQVLSASEAPEALWMAIVSLDRVVKADPDERQGDELEGLIADFINRYPSSEYTPRLILRQTDLGVAEPSLARVDSLLSIPANSGDYDLAQRKAAQMLYELYRAGSGTDRAELGQRYVSLAFALWSRAEVERVLADKTELQVFLVRARRILEVSLASDVARVSSAREILDKLEGISLDHGLELGAIDDELDYRRVQLAIATDRFDQARLYADRSWDRRSGNDWARASVRLVFREAVRTWRDATATEDTRDVLDRVVQYGKRLLKEYEDDESALDDQNTLIYFATVGEAAMDIWERSADHDSGRFALLLYKTLLAARPSNALFLRSVGVLAAAYEEPEVSLAAWRHLANGSDPGSERWYEAKYNLIRVQIELDPSRARLVFDQHRALNPDLGPDVWGARFRQLDRDIDLAVRVQQNDGNTDSRGAG